MDRKGYRPGSVFIDFDHAENDCDYVDNDGCPRYIALPHKCDRWDIGDAEQAAQLIIDLQEAIKKLNNPA